MDFSNATILSIVLNITHLCPQTFFVSQNFMFVSMCLHIFMWLIQQTCMCYKSVLLTSYPSCHGIFCICTSFSGLKIMSSIYQTPAILPVLFQAIPWPGNATLLSTPCRRPRLFVCLCPKSDTVLWRWRGRDCPWPDLSPLLLLNARVLWLWWKTHLLTL